ncbi:hypothetical protein HK22_02105 [Gluconobacter sp. DsW_056]|uniref:hypothetical protein n=1 Tax=Gluconobacter sp. DsW_056 TaxID=1511209 RepID=UPI000A387D55|nr:hypothetical protein [Gluconobacter sp. DsW_056]OUI81672.1 hypothetical protein HK22_02105 [Gluconobacter sp. DsW_056]
MSSLKNRLFGVTMVLSLALSASFLAGCTNTVVTQKKTYFTVESLYTEAANIAVQYESGSFGTPDPEVVKQIKFYNDQAHTAIVAVRTKVEAGQSITDTSLTLATTAIDSFVAYLNAKNITVTSSDPTLSATATNTTAAVDANSN